MTISDVIELYTASIAGGWALGLLVSILRMVIIPWYNVYER